MNYSSHLQKVCNHLLFAVLHAKGSQNHPLDPAQGLSTLLCSLVGMYKFLWGGNIVQQYGADSSKSR